MSLSEPYDDRLMADLAAAADGTLPPARQAELEAMAEADPDLAAALDEQRRAVTLIQGAAAEIRAPLALRERLENERVRAAKPAPRRRWFSIALAGAAAAAVFLAVLFAAPGRPDRRGRRRVRRPARDGRRAHGERPAARHRAERRRLPGVGGEVRLGGDRHADTGEIDGREATTVYYEKEGKTLAYTIVSGDALDTPDDTTTIEVEGTPVEVFRADGTPAATWERDGHTCVLLGDGVEDAKLAELAGWRAKGGIPF